MATKTPAKKASKQASKKASKQAQKKSSTQAPAGISGGVDPDPCALRFLYCDPPTPPEHCPVCCELGPLSADERAKCSHHIRVEAADLEINPQRHPCNGDEACFDGRPLEGEDRRCGDDFAKLFIASFTKGLPHNEYGEVDADAYCALLRAMASGDPGDFEQVPLGCTLPQCRPPGCPPECGRPSRFLEDPQSAFAFDLEGADSHALVMKPAPSFDSEEEVAEIAENYWMALARDVPFTEYETDPLIKEAADDLSKYICFRGPTNPTYLFRGVYLGEQEGPYVSQFLYRDTPYGSQFIPAMIRTVLPEVDYMTAYGDWLEVQNGCDRDQMFCDPVPRFIRDGRDLGQYVHVDLTFNAFLNAGLILMSGRDPLRRCEARAGMGTEFARCLPYVNPMAPMPEQFPDKSANQIGFSTFGPPHLASLLLETMNRALKAVWFQKWGVHRRLRPEEFAGRIHNRLVNGRPYPFAPANFAQLQSVVLPRVLRHNTVQNNNRRRLPPGLALPPNTAPGGGTYLLPMAFAEGSPIHPAYGAGHATVAGALATILKAFFPREQLILDPVVATPDGLSLIPWEPAIETDARLTVEGEINKLAGNIALGRNFAGVHWRSDYAESVLLGEQVAISILCDQRNTYNEAYEFRFRGFDGRLIRIRPAGPEERCPAGRFEPQDQSEPEDDVIVRRRCARSRRPNAPSC
ncbi:MAG TPA: vanadium-dependent haloperoxidase [Pyrinomonadaceae bacterium]|jgi:hypothetical protein